MDAFGVMGYSAENLTAGRKTVAEAVESWKASPPHNRNLLMPQARHVGLARADADGSYRRYWALVLGSETLPCGGWAAMAAMCRVRH